jgi:hypothetical protein
MTPRLAPWAVWAGLALVGLVVLIALGSAAGLKWDPLGLQPRRLAAAQARAERAESDALARRLERDGEIAQRARLDIHHQQRVQVDAATVAARLKAEQAHDAHQTLDPQRARRLGDHDRELCRLAPDLAGCPAAP